MPPKIESGLTLLGYIAFLDPPKESAREAIAALASRGVQVKILTGDNETITRKICQEVGLDPGEILSGGRIAQMSDSELAEAAERANVFVKLTPAQKDRVIQALHARDHVVGFLGDGVNDSPALKAADVGISVDTAVDIAKESADIILLEKIFWSCRRASSKGGRFSPISSNTSKWARVRISAICSASSARVSSSLSCRWRRYRS